MQNLGTICHRTGTGPALVAVHTPGLDHTLFRPWLDPLGQTFEVIYCDHAGCGRSPTLPRAPTTRRFWVDGLEALREHLGIERWCLLGHSFGGFLALEYAHAHPDRVQGLILISTAAHRHYAMPLAELMPTMAASLRHAFESLLDGPPTDSELASAWKTVVPMYMREPSDELGHRLAADMRFDALSYGAATRLVRSYDATPLLKDVSAPTLVISGENDPLTPADICLPPLASGLPRATPCTLPTGHFPFAEAPHGFVTAVTSWWKDLSSR